LINASGKKQAATMASKRSNATDDWTGRKLDFAEFAAELGARRAELGQPELPRHASKNRTPRKLALLKAIEDAGGKR
jgi:hypothetical protein